MSLPRAQYMEINNVSLNDADFTEDYLIQQQNESELVAHKVPGSVGGYMKVYLKQPVLVAATEAANENPGH